ncbi:hypothetical protein SGFS_061360 [Streptomyces graminofaciens]|uniref:Uncharacterized protein n=1 Tax=Streptomyces graminofaciens TaxID=68212 RepID=A0ABN5VN02_9ACTN|nr:hypothetical protein SGFS_061360 [Streptomyces graminofaciens]
MTDGLAPVEFGEGVQEPEGVVGEVLMVGRPWDQPRRIHRQPLPDLRHMLMHGGRERGLIGELRETGRERAADPRQRGRRGLRGQGHHSKVGGAGAFIVAPEAFPAFIAYVSQPSTSLR